MVTPHRVVKEGFSEEVTDLRKSIPRREKSKCKGLEGEMERYVRAGVLHMGPQPAASPGNQLEM